MDRENLIEELIDLAIEEDVYTGDISTDAIIPVNSRATALMTAKAEGVISGLEVIRKVYERFEDDFGWKPYVRDGQKVRKGDKILEITAQYRTLLYGERLSLNILQRMSGIATATARFVAELEGTGTVILDTRKTAPGMRVLDKMAVRDGGGHNHRMGLYDMVMLKDNHIKIAGGIPQAVAAVKGNLPLSVKLEVETTSLEEVRQAVEAGADIIMFDNMDNATMAEAVRIVGGRAKTEASGNMSIPRLKEVAATGVDYISVGALTHSVTALDISMNIIQE
ncbi:MAG: carboxylating nicotinate-nucleotide diphosphorylase [Bacteroidetes bacterium]|uniref:Probable nicotinate-nucleotide pyrophosphorylase [carboxylating] n=1 Tax=Candidatus Cryptobacteroides merdigallinarum TaxID=2840770 RepID=A0A9D9HF54_9BACT|nr:carboxylating nicotinate-nucleotide diphosphorylase [Candidatus Cryptobacteroides merdigallinarum]